MRFQFKNQLFLFLFLFGCCYGPLFLHLDHLPLRQFDEARLANNAIEMLKTGNHLVPHYRGEPDMWSTKPPLMIGLQTIALKYIGYNELAIRLPAALAGLWTVFLLAYFFIIKWKKPLIGISAGLVLITTPGFIDWHVTRTGDYDALLVLWMTTYVFAFYSYLESSNETEKRKYLVLTVIAIILAAWTKGIAGMLFLPGLFLYVLLEGRLKSTLLDSRIWLSGFMVLFFIGAYYYWREQLNPGYIDAVISNEIAGRYLDTLEEHHQPFYFYFHQLYTQKFSYWIYFLPIGILTMVKQKENQLLRLLLLTSICLLAVLSFSQTKLYWYMAPVYPMLSVIVGFGIAYIYQGLKQVADLPSWGLLLVGGIAIFGFPYQSIINKVYHPKEYGYPMDQYTSYIKKTNDIENWVIATYWNRSNLRFYKKAYEQSGIALQLKKPMNLKVNEQAIVCEEDAFKFINENYEYALLETWMACQKIKILKKKK